MICTGGSYRMNSGCRKQPPLLSRTPETRGQLRTNEKNRIYHARKVTDKIAIYADSVYQGYTCLKCHVHNTEEIRLAHELHGVADFHRCFVCHQTEIDGTTYGRQRTNWEYDPNW